MLKALITFGLVLWSGIARSSPPPVTIGVTPVFSFEPSTVRATVKVQPDYQNRYLCIGWLSPQRGEKMSCFEIDGQYAAVTYYREWRDLAWGDYEAVAMVIKTRGSNISPYVMFRIEESIPR